jgi:hypothetical protein
MLKANYLSALYVVKSLLDISIVQSGEKSERNTLVQDKESNESLNVSKSKFCLVSGVPIPHCLPTRIIFVGSIMSVLSFIGFSGYAGSF